MAISNLEPAQQEEVNDFLSRADESEYSRFQGVNPYDTVGNMVGPDHFGDFSEDGHVVVEVHGNLADYSYFEKLNSRLEGSEVDFRPYALETVKRAPNIEDYVKELDKAYNCLKIEEGIESYSIVAHSLGCVGSLQWIHENEAYSELNTFVPSAGPFKGVAAADLAAKLDRSVNMIESSLKLMSTVNPFVNTRDIEGFFEQFKVGGVSDEFVSRKSAEKGELAELMEETRITEAADVYTIRSSMDRWYNLLENTLPAGTEYLADLVSWENRVDSPEISDAEGNLVLPSSTHHEAIEGDIAVEYIARALEA